MKNNNSSVKKSTAKDFKWLFLDAYVDLMEKIAKGGYINGSDRSQLISMDVLALGTILDPMKVIADKTNPLFSHMQRYTEINEVEAICQEIVKIVANYKKQRRNNQIPSKKSKKKTVIEFRIPRWLTEDFEWLVADMYVDLVERIIKEGYMDGSESAHNLARNMVEIKAILGVSKIKTKGFDLFFEGIKTPSTKEEFKTECEHILDEIEHYRTTSQEEIDDKKERDRIFPLQWTTEEFRGLVLDSYVNLAEKIIQEGYMDGSERSQLIAIDMVSLRATIDTNNVLEDTILGSFGSMEIPGADIEEDTRYALKGIKKYREQRKRATK